MYGYGAGNQPLRSAKGQILEVKQPDGSYGGRQYYSNLICQSGDSGSGMFNASGELTGVNRAVDDRDGARNGVYQGYSLTVPLEYLRPYVTQSCPNCPSGGFDPPQPRPSPGPQPSPNRPLPENYPTPAPKPPLPGPVEPQPTQPAPQPPLVPVQPVTPPVQPSPVQPTTPPVAGKDGKDGQPGPAGPPGKDADIGPVLAMIAELKSQNVQLAIAVNEIKNQPQKPCDPAVIKQVIVEQLQAHLRVSVEPLAK
jgi:hypothetical protein